MSKCPTNKNKVCFVEISEFEREALKQQFAEELHQLHEIQGILEEAVAEASISRKILSQRLKVQRLERSLVGRIEQVEIERHLKMLTIDIHTMKKLRFALKKRRISRIDPKRLWSEIVLLEDKFTDEIYKEECGLKTGFKSFPISENEFEILSEMMVV